MSAPPALTAGQWSQIQDALAWTLARIVVGHTPPMHAAHNWTFAKALSTPRTDTWARDLCTEGYRAYEAVVAQHGEQAAMNQVASDAEVEAELDRLEPLAASLLSATLRADAAWEWRAMPAGLRAEWIADVHGPRNPPRRPAVWAQAGSGPAIVPQIGMPDIANTPMLGEVGPDGVYRLKPRPQGPFQPGWIP
jgi:hypothetical protein